ncbi:MAG: hypothetical protein PHD95_02840 [Candidatus ainarchaeum sp.]|nr:hypothetical protein [Candidatus ainarchaeum sp.]
MKKNSLKIAIVLPVLLATIALAGCAGDPFQQSQAYCDAQSQAYGEIANICLPAGSPQLNAAAGFNQAPIPTYASAVQTKCVWNPGVFGIGSSWTLTIPVLKECTPDQYAGCKLDSDGINADCYNPTNDDGHTIPPIDDGTGGTLPEM